LSENLPTTESFDRSQVRHGVHDLGYNQRPRSSRKNPGFSPPKMSTNSTSEEVIHYCKGRLIPKNVGGATILLSINTISPAIFISSTIQI
jgi:hypothetical protein